MTQPDELHPVSAANYSSFAGFANTSQADWEAQINGSLTGINPLSGVCALIGQLPFLSGLAGYGGFGEDVETGVGTGIVNGIQILADAACGLLTGSFGFFGSTPNTMFTLFQKIMDLIFENPFMKLLTEIVNETGDLVFDILNGLFEFAGKILEVLFGIFNPGKILDVVTEIFDTLFGFFGGFGTGTAQGGGILGMVNNFIDWGGRVWDVVQGFLDIFVGVFGGFTSFLDRLNGLVDLPDGTDLGGGLLGTVGTALGGFVSFAERFIGTLLDLPNLLTNIPIGNIAGLATNFLQSAVGAGNELVDRVSTQFFVGFDEGLGRIATTFGIPFTPISSPTSKTAFHTAATVSAAAGGSLSSTTVGGAFASVTAASANIGASLNGFFRAILFR